MTRRTYSGAQPFLPDEDRREILAGIDQVLQSGQLTQSDHVKRFEVAAAEMAGVRHAVAVNSGGAALEIALEALDVAGYDVVVPTETFVASANSVVRAGGRPVFADVRLDDLSLSVATIEAALTPNTKAVMLVHMFGLMSSEIPAIRALCERRGLALIEDAAHAHGATFGSRRAGGIGTAGCFSYYATKVLTAGEGGVVTTDDDAYAERVRSIRDHGRQGNSSVFDYAGNNFRLAEIPALIGSVQHRRLPQILAHRRRIAEIYREALGNAAHVRLIDPVPRQGHSYWRYALLLDVGIDRAAVQAAMLDRGGTRVTWMYEPLCHQQPYYAKQSQYPVSLPIAESVVGRMINLPTHSGVDEEGAHMIAATLQSVVAELADR